MTGSENFQNMFFTLKSMRMDTVMRREKFFYRATFLADEKSMVFVWFWTLTCAPFSESGDMVYEFLFP